MFTKRTIRDYDVDGKRVLVRVDYNVPLTDDGAVADTYRIRQSIETIQYLRERGCKVILLSHLGRPTENGDPKTTLRPLVHELNVLLSMEVQFVNDCVGDGVKTLADHLEPGQVLLLENIRYYPEEEKNSDEFARRIIESTGAEVFVQDGFGVVHRAHTSTDAIARIIPAVSGLLLEREVRTIQGVMEQPERPLLVVVGGAKISDKIDVLHQFIERADAVAVVGAMANTFLAAQNVPVGASLYESDELDTARDILHRAREIALERPFTFFLPKDVVVATSTENTASTRVVDLSHYTWADITAYPKKPDVISFEVQPEEKILDIGPFSAAYIAGMATQAKTAIWNGTCGVAEVSGLAGAAAPFAHGTRIVVDGLVGERGDEKNHPFTVVGGGDTVAYVETVPGLRERFGHVSTGGGASLELMSGKELPGVAVLWEKEQ